MKMAAALCWSVPASTDADYLSCERINSNEISFLLEASSERGKQTVIQTLAKSERSSETSGGGV